MISKPRSLKSQLKTYSFFENIIISSNKILQDWESDMAGGICMLRNLSGDIGKCNVLIKQNAGYEILARELHARQQYHLWDIAHIVLKLCTRPYWKDWPLKTRFGKDARQFVDMHLSEAHKYCCRSADIELRWQWRYCYMQCCILRQPILCV